MEENNVEPVELNPVSNIPGVRSLPDGTKEVTLKHPLRHGNNEIETVIIKPPIADQLCRYGHPVRENKNGEVSFKYDVVVEYIQAMNALPPSVVKHMVYQDLHRCTLALISFFTLDT